MCFLILSGAATGASWLCYFKALQLGTVNQVVPIDKSSTVLTILLALIFLQEGVSLPKLLAALTIGVGIFLMIERKNEEEGKTGGKGWMIYAWGSAFFASLTSILGKIGISGVESNLGTAIRTGVVLVMAWLVVLAAGKVKEVKQIPGRELGLICCHRSLLAVLLSGPSAGACQRGGAGRQAEHFGDHSLFLSGFWRTAVRAVGGRTSAADGRNGADGCCIDGG